MRKLFKIIGDLLKTRVSFIDGERKLRKGYLVQYVLRETDGKKILKEPLLLAIVEPYDGFDRSADGKIAIIHHSVPASDVQIM